MRGKGRCLVRLAALLTTLVLSSATAWAGQLHVVPFGLSKVASDRGFALEVRVVAVVKANKRTTVRARVEKVWALPGKAPTAVPPAQVVAFDIYTGLVWNNPRVSPIDRRVWNHVAVSSLRPNQRVVLVPVGGQGRAFTDFRYEPTAAGRKASRKLAVFFRQGGRATYGRTRTAQLARDLTDFDLFDLAYKTLTIRNALTARHVFRLSPARQRRVLNKHLGTLKGRALQHFLGAARRMVARRPKQVITLLKSLRWSMQPNLLATVAPLANLLDPRTKAGLAMIHDLITSLSYPMSKPKAQKHAHLFIPFMVRWAAYRPRYASDAKAFKKFFKLLQGKHRMICIRRLFKHVTTSTQVSRGAGYDWGLLAIVAGEVVRHPSPAYLSLVRKFNPELPSYTSRKGAVFQHMMAMAVAIGTQHPKTRARLKRLILKHIKYEDRVPPKTVRAWRRLERLTP